MATTVARLQAVLSADTRDFDQAMHKSEGRMKSIAKTGAFAAGAAGVGAIALTLRAGIKEWTESTKVTAQTNAVIKSTGGVAGVTAKHVDDLANTMLKKTGIDDEAIRTSENLLLGFTNLRNEVGKGNDVFDRTTKIVQDYAVRTGKSATTASIAFGKAINDPVKGMTALGRAGVILTDVQKKTIKGFVDSGNPIKAQTYLLGLLEQRFGGAAEAAGKTLPGQINIAKESFNNFAGDLITKMIPVLERMVAWVRQNWPQISATFKQTWASIKPTLIALGVLVASVVESIRKHWSTIGPIVMAVVSIVRAQLQIVTNVIKLFAAILRGDWSEAWNSLKGIVFGVLNVIKGYLNTYKEIFGALGRAIGAAFKSGLVAGWAGIQKLASAAIQPVIDIFKKLFGWIQSAVDAVKRLVGWLGKLKPPSLGSLNPFGDPANPNFTGPGGGTGPASISPHLYDELAGSRRFGLTLTSGYRPGAVTKHGTPSDHGIYPSHAIDVAGSASGMAGFFRWLIGQRDVKQAFYDPLGSIFGGVLSSYREGGHSDHVHVATYDKGGFLRPGWNLAYNGLGRNEQVGGNVTIPVSIGGEHIATVVFDMLRRKAKVYENRNARPAFGGA